MDGPAVGEPKKKKGKLPKEGELQRKKGKKLETRNKRSRTP